MITLRRVDNCIFGSFLKRKTSLKKVNLTDDVDTLVESVTDRLNELSEGYKPNRMRKPTKTHQGFYACTHAVQNGFSIILTNQFNRVNNLLVCNIIVRSKNLN